MDAELANALVMPDLSLYNFIALTVFAPYTVLLEGFRTELAFLFESTLQARAELIEAAKLTFVKSRLTSKDIELKYKHYPTLPMAGLRSTAGTQVLEKLVRGAWREGKGGLFAFSTTGGRRSGPGAMKAYGLDGSASLLDQYLDMLLARCQALDGAVGAGNDYVNAERAFPQNLHNVVRASTLDGAVLLDRRLRMRAFGAKLGARPLGNLEIQHVGGRQVLDLKTKGTRHLSAASWVAAGKGRMAVVVSQDRAANIFECGPGSRVVYLNVRPGLFED